MCETAFVDERLCVSSTLFPVFLDLTPIVRLVSQVQEKRLCVSTFIFYFIAAPWSDKGAWRRLVLMSVQYLRRARLEDIRRFERAEKAASGVKRYVFCFEQRQFRRNGDENSGLTVVSPYLYREQYFSGAYSCLADALRRELFG